jgi:hypothetical protein
MMRREPLLPLHGRRRHQKRCSWPSLGLVALVACTLLFIFSQSSGLHGTGSSSLAVPKATARSGVSSRTPGGASTSGSVSRGKWSRSEDEHTCVRDEAPEAVKAREAAMAVAGEAGKSGVARGKRYAIISTWPPTKCGLATFSAGLRGGLLELGAKSVDVIAVHLRTARSTAYGPEVWPFYSSSVLLWAVICRDDRPSDAGDSNLVLVLRW